MRTTSRLRPRLLSHALTGLIAFLLLVGMLPAPQPEPASATQYPGSFQINTYACPPGSDVAGFDLVNCQATPLGLVQLTLSTSAGDVFPQSSNEFGVATWYSVPAGFTTLAIGMPNGYVSVRVFCGDYFAPALTMAEIAVDAGNSIGIEMPAAAPMRCHLYFLQATPVDADPPPDDGTGEGDQTGSGEGETGGQTGSPGDALTLHVFGCPPDYTTDTPPIEVLFNCQPAQQELFFLDGIDNSNQLPDEEGKIRWENLGSGSVGLIHVRFDREFSPLRVACATFATDAGPVEYLDQAVNTESNPRIDLQMQAGQSIDCIWYIVPRVAQAGVRTFVCTSEFDRDGDIAAQLGDEQRCRPGPDGRVITYTTTGGDVLVQIVGGDGWTGLSMLPPGEVQISPTQIEGYPGVHVRCNVRPWTVLRAQGHDETSLVDGRVVVDLEAGEEVECLWINIAQDDDQLPPVDTDEDDGTPINGDDVVDTDDGFGEFRMYKYVCPPGTTGPYGDLARDCQETPSGVTFTVQRNGQVESGMSTDDFGYAEVDALAAGPVTIVEESGYSSGTPGTETLPLWQPRVFCAEYALNGGTIGELVEAPVRDYIGVDLTVRDGYVTLCEWFNIPAANGEAPPDEDAPFSITVYKYACTDGRVAPTTQEFRETGLADVWAEECDPLEGVTFNYRAETRSGGQTTVHYDESRQTDGNGYATWTNLPSELEITGGQGGTRSAFLTEVETPGEYATAVVECTNGSGSFGPADGAYVGLYPEDGAVTCRWFNLTEPDGAPPIESGRVVIHKHMCGSGVTTGAGYQDLLAACTNSITGSDYTFMIGLEDSASATTDESGTVAWDPVPPGTVTLTEQLDGLPYRAVGVYCAYYPESSFPTSYAPLELMGDPTAPYVTYELESDYVLDCQWFNAPYDEEYVAVTALKYLCAPGVDPATAAIQELIDSCRRQYDHPMTLTDSSGTELSLPTGMDGRVYWPEVISGDFTMSEPSSPNYRPALVNCDAFPMDGSPSDYQSIEISETSITYAVAAGERAHCVWYNAWIGTPEDYEVGYGRVGVYKYVCPESTVYEGASHSDLSALCDMTQSGVPFHFNYSDGESLDTATGQNGIAGTGPVPNGMIGIVEYEQAGYLTAAVFCATGLAGNPLPAMERVETESVDSQTSVSLEMRAGYFLRCDWFNIPVVNGDNGQYTPTPTYTATYTATPTYTPTVNAGFEEGQDETPTYTVEAPPDYTPTYTYTPEYTPTYTPTYAETPDYTPTYTPTLAAGVPPPPTATYTATLADGAPPPPATSTAIRVDGNGPTGTPTPTPTAAIVIVKHVCEPGYEPITDEADPAEDCDEEVEPVAFRLYEGDEELDEATTEEEDDEQQVRFDDLEASIYQIAEDPETEISTAFIGGCTSNVRTFGEYAFLPYAVVDAEGRVTVQLLEGEELVCDWYNVPRAEGTVDISLVVCPGRVPNPARCDPADDQMDVDLIPLEDGESIATTADDEGETSITAPAGTYQVAVEGEPACLVDSASVDDDGNLVIEPGETVQATVYRCEGE